VNVRSSERAELETQSSKMQPGRTQKGRKIKEILASGCASARLPADAKACLGTLEVPRPPVFHLCFQERAMKLASFRGV